VASIPEIDDAERWVVESALRERYGERVATDLADTALQLHPGDASLTSCPTLYWEERGAAFVIAKTGDGRYRAMFFYPDDPMEEQYGAGKPEYGDLLECVTSLLRVQADHEKERKGVYSGKTGRELRGTVERDAFDADVDPEEDPDNR
jgi:hypothetical protein